MYGDDLPIASATGGSTLQIGPDPIYIAVGSTLPGIQIR